MINFPPPRNVRKEQLLQLHTPPMATPQVTSLTWELDSLGRVKVPKVQASSTVGGRGDRTIGAAGYQELLCPPCPKHFLPVNSNSPQSCWRRGTTNEETETRRGTHLFRVTQQCSWDVNPEPSPCPQASILFSTISLYIQSGPASIAGISHSVLSLKPGSGRCPIGSNPASYPAPGVVFPECKAVFSSTQKSFMAPCHFQVKVQIPLASASFLTTLDHSPFLDYLPYLPWGVFHHLFPLSPLHRVNFSFSLEAQLQHYLLHEASPDSGALPWGCCLFPQGDDSSSQGLLAHCHHVCPRPPPSIDDHIQLTIQASKHGFGSRVAPQPGRAHILSQVVSCRQ